MNRAAFYVVLAFALLLLLCACTPDDRPCLAAHDEEYTYVQMILIGFTNGVPNYMYLPTVGTMTVCDKYGESATRFADGTLKKK